MTYANTPTPTALRLMADREIVTCECEGCDRPAVHAHHCLYGRDKRYPELNDDENLQLVCYQCHFVTGKADSWENRQFFWGVQCERYGSDHMIEWHDNLRLKVKEKIYR